MRMNDAELLRLFLERSERAIAETEQKYGGFCRRLAQRILANSEDAEECVSDVLMKLWQQIPPAKPQNLEAFIITLTQHTALDRIRRQQAQKRGGGETTASLEDVGDTLRAGETVEDTIGHRLLTEAVERFLDTLSDDAQTIFTERWHNESQPREIAEKFGISGAHVRKSLMQTRRKLKAYLKKEGLL